MEIYTKMGCFVVKQKFLDEDNVCMPDLCFGMKLGNVEEFVICSCVEVKPPHRSR